MGEQPYRAATLPEARPPPPPEHVYIAHERDLNAAFHRVWIRTCLFGLGGGACVATQMPAAAWVVILGVLGWSIWSWRRTRRGDAIVFRVERGQLTVTARGSSRPILAPLPLRKVLDVALDSRSIAPVMRDTSIAAVAPRMKVRGEVDIAGIIIVPEGPGEPVPITAEHVAHMDAIEGAGEDSDVSSCPWLVARGREGAAGSGVASGGFSRAREASWGRSRRSPREERARRTQCAPPKVGSTADQGHGEAR